MSAPTTATGSSSLGAVRVDCPHAEACSGCALIHLDYAQQLARKNNTLAETLDGFELLRHLAPQSVHPAHRLTDYRGRAKLVAAAPAQLGLYGAGHQVVDIPECRVLTPLLRDAANELRRLMRQAGGDDAAGALLGVDLRALAGPQGDACLVTLILRDDFKERARIATLAEAVMQRVQGAVGVAVSWRPASSPRVLGSAPEPVAGAGLSADEIGGVSHPASSGAFVQANREMAELLHRTLADALDGSLGGLPNKQLLELYAGSGAIARALATRGAELTIVEQQASAAEAARNLSAQGIRVLHADAARARELLAPSVFDAVIVNPPRRGLSPDVRRDLSQLARQAVAYVSCHPGTLFRDLEHLALLGWHCHTLVPFDMMPLTDQIETLAVLAPGPPPAVTLLHEDEQLIAVVKAPHEPTTPQGEHDHSLLERVRRLSGCAEAQPIHRLDIGTSGVCLFARTARDVAPLSRSLSRGDKIYLSWLHGVTRPKGSIQRALEEHGRRQPARTRYRRLRVVSGHSLCALMPDQGRRHQIRRHMAQLGHAVLGDERYGKAAANRHQREKRGLDRTFLHLARISLERASGKRIELSAPLPGDLRLVLGEPPRILGETPLRSLEQALMTAFRADR